MHYDFFTHHSEKLYIGGLSILSLLIHLIPFFRYHTNPLGYDTGFYRRYLIEPFLSFPNNPVPGLGDDAVLPRFFLDILRIPHIPTDIALYGSYIFFFVLLPILLYYLLKPTLGIRGALIGSLFMSLSPVAYTAYWYFLYKNSFALLLILLAYLSIEKRLFVPVLALDVAIGLSHKTTALMYIATLVVLILLERKRAKEFLIHLLTTSSILCAVAYPALHEATRALPVGVFLNWTSYMQLSFAFLITTTLGVHAFKKIKVPKTLLSLLIVSVLITLFKLPFYERIFVFLDIALVTLCATTVEHMIRKIETGTPHRYRYLSVLCILTGSLVGTLWYQIKNLKPLTPSNEISRIEKIATLVPPGATILTSTDEAPWFEGWTNAHIAAPGMLNDIHNYEEWDAYWNATSTQFKVSFLKTYPRPLYISTANDYADLASSTCMERVESTLLKYSCE